MQQLFKPATAFMKILQATRTERRGPNRAKNVARLPKLEIQHGETAPALERTGTEDQ